MLTSLSLVFLVGLLLAALSGKLGLPRIIGMLCAGILLGPCVLGLLDESILAVSSDLRQMALVIILIKAGLSLNLDDLKKVGRSALLMSFLPALCEILAFVWFAPAVLGVDRIQAAIIGAVLGAVSPAVVVPRMVELMERGYGTDKRIPQMILAGASLDDVFVIVLFTSFVRMAQGGEASAAEFVSVPVSIVLGLCLGAAAGWGLHLFFEACFARGHKIRGSMKVIILLGASFALLGVEDLLESIVPVSGLLAIMSMAMMLAKRSEETVTKRLKEKFGALWLAAEVILFVLVGAAVDIRYTLKAGPLALAMIGIGLLLRSVGVCLCMIGTPLNHKERLYCVLAYLPKATVQAAIGSVPLSLGLPGGELVLSIAVLSILITAPLGALAMDKTYAKLLRQEKQ